MPATDATASYFLTEADNAWIRRAHTWNDAHREERRVALVSLIERAKAQRRERDRLSCEALEAMRRKCFEVQPRGWHGPPQLPSHSATPSEAYGRLSRSTRQAMDLLAACDRLLTDEVPDANDPRGRSAWASEVLALADCRKGPGRRAFWAWMLAGPSRARRFLPLVEVALTIVEPRGSGTPRDEREVGLDECCLAILAVLRWASVHGCGMQASQIKKAIALEPGRDETVKGAVVAVMEAGFKRQERSIDAVERAIRDRLIPAGFEIQNPRNGSGYWLVK